MNTKVLIMALGCITLLEVIALSKNMNGIALSTTTAILAGLAGYGIKKVA